MKRISGKFLLPVLFIWSMPLAGQGLFSSTLAKGDNKETGILDIGGYMRGTLYTGWNSRDEAEIKSGYAESALKLTAKPNKWGKAYADIRFRSGYFEGNTASLFDVREAYVDLYLNKFDFRFGKQIKVWGRADAFNPTQNLTPYDYFNRSPNDDDRRLGNLVFTGRFHPASFLKIEMDWAPFYQASIYRFDLIDLPEFVSFTEGNYPSPKLKNGSFGCKIDLVLNKIEGSLSYFTGYDAMPGLLPVGLPQPPFTDFTILLAPSAFKQSTIGADFATNLGGMGFRGELAWKQPEKDITNPALPMEEISWAIGLDRSFGPLRILLEYTGKKVMDFTALDAPGEFDPAILQDPSVWPYLENMIGSQIRYYNRILYDQTDEWIHSLLVRPSISLFHETLDLEIAGLYNITTEEYMIRPMVSYRLADGIECIAGYEHYYGPVNTRFDWISNIFNGPFMEFRINF